jgi:hypothetical protein
MTLIVELHCKVQNTANDKLVKKKATLYHQPQPPNVCLNNAEPRDSLSVLLFQL